MPGKKIVRTLDKGFYHYSDYARAKGICGGEIAAFQVMGLLYEDKRLELDGTIYFQHKESSENEIWGIA